MLASGSDDGTIRIWGLGHLNIKHRDRVHETNGVLHHCNGS